MKTVTSRDSATSILRKLKVNPRDYNLFIKIAEVEGGKIFTIDDVAAERHVKKGIIVIAEEMRPRVKKSAAKVAKEKKAAADKKAADKPDSISSVARQLILDGKTNNEVWEQLQRQFNVDGTKKHYPAWYRSEMKRKGLIK